MNRRKYHIRKKLSEVLRSLGYDVKRMNCLGILKNKTLIILDTENTYAGKDIRKVKYVGVEYNCEGYSFLNRISFVEKGKLLRFEDVV